MEGKQEATCELIFPFFPPQRAQRFDRPGRKEVGPPIAALILDGSVSSDDRKPRRATGGAVRQLIRASLGGRGLRRIPRPGCEDSEWSRVRSRELIRGIISIQ